MGTAEAQPAGGIGRVSVILQKVYVPSKKDLVATFVLDGVSRSTAVDKDAAEEQSEMHVWDREVPIFEESVMLIKVESKETIGKNKLLGDVIYSLRQLVSTEQACDVKTNLKDPTGKPSENFIQFKVEYVKPTLDPDEIEGTKEDDGKGGKVARTGKGTGSKQLDRSTLSKKPQEFQVRVFVHEARNLFGGNLHPVCNITIGKVSKHTRVKRSTAKPKWDECLIYDFNMSPAELCDKPIEIEVMNSKKMRSDSLVGSFKFDVGEVYACNDHTFWHKWVMLVDPVDKDSGTKGYVLVSITILGPGDKIRSPPKLSGADESIDMESNVLQPAGIQLQPTTFTIRVFKAEDLPEMDSDAFTGVKKALGMRQEGTDKVDPYVIVSFAGKKLKTRVVPNSYCPVWNQELNMGVQVPTMCEKLLVKIMDKDHMNKDDVVATKMLQLQGLSSADPDDEGFLPTFGPAFVCFYGSPREFNTLFMELEGLDKGLGEGCSFRGRLLMQLSVRNGVYPTPEEYVKGIENDDIFSCQNFLRRRKYRILVGFLEAAMIHPVDGPIEFEVSIGEYGNKYSAGTHPVSSPSTTQPQNALFDGQSYYFMPWRETKPCIMLISQWEDNTQRIDTLNFILKIIANLEENMRGVKLSMRAEAPLEESARKLMYLLDDLIDDLDNVLPDLPAHSTDLDQKMYRLRSDDMQTISEEARELKENAIYLEAAVEEVETYIDRLNCLAVEPQNSIPDLIVWMLVAGRREAYIRIPSHHIMHSSQKEFAGKHCGQVSTFLLQKPCLEEKKNTKGNWTLPGKLQLFIWMGLDDAAKKIQHKPYGGEISVFAETYENQIFVPPSWTTKMMSRPKFSDSTGRSKLPIECFQAPSGWLWDDEWFIQPQMNHTSRQGTLTKYQENVYENMVRIPGGQWNTGEITWTNANGEEAHNKNEIESPEGWDWTDDWQIDLTRAVDENGFEYSLDNTLAGFVPVEKTYHLQRRRRWVRNRKRNPNSKQIAVKEKQQEEAKEGWEYARLWTSKFHPFGKKMDMVRRRLWLRKMVTNNPDTEPVFTLSADDDQSGGETLEPTDVHKPGQMPVRYAPRMYLTYREMKTYQLRAYLYQARDLFSEDSSGLSDPYAQVIFGNQSKSTKIIPETLCPTWNQTIILDSVQIWGDPADVAIQPPAVVIELFDYDAVGHDFLGRTVAQPTVILFSDDSMETKLNWYEVTRGGEHGGEILAAFELFLFKDEAELPALPPVVEDYYILPNGIRPVMQHTRIEVLTWGVRNMKKFNMSAINNPSIEIECAGMVASTNKIKNCKKNPNFDETSFYFDVYLPIKELYMPPLNIRLLDHRTFGLKPLVGTHTLHSFKEYRRDPVLQFQAIKDKLLQDKLGKKTDNEFEIERGRGTPEGEGSSTVSTYKSILDTASKTLKGSLRGKKTYSWFGQNSEGSEEDTDSQWEPVLAADDEEDVLTDDLDWWSKYFASVGDDKLGKVFNERGHEAMEYFEEELEHYFDNFQDLAESYPIWHRKQNDEEDDIDSALGNFKGTFRIYPLPADGSEPPPRMLQNAPSNEPIELIVRVYVIKATGLQPQDPNGFSDPYPAVRLGKLRIKDVDNYKAKCLDPMFGTMYEMDCTIPLQSELRVQIYDYDLLSGDDLIGETKIDLENRYLSTRRGICGLPKRYYVSGPYAWRDSEKPKEILEAWCGAQTLCPPMWSGNCRVRVAEKLYLLSNYEVKGMVHHDWGPADERLALYVLLDLKLVPEHIEQRTLYNPLRPEMPQGLLEMFVDIFPKSREIPPSINIIPRAPQDLEMRVIIWNCSDVILADVSLTGQCMSDIYVKGWLKGHDKKQKTDVHYRSLNGDGNFNWRFVFPFKYLPAEEVMVIKKKEHFFSLEKHEEKHPVMFVVQIWDNDIFHADDFLGVLELDLHCMPKASKFAKFASLDNLIDNEKGKEVQTLSLFNQKNVKGWWPCYVDYDPTIPRELTGKVEMELEILTKEDAEDKPAGKAREEPNDNPHLKDPDRPATSFGWFTSPLKTLRYIIWQNYKWHILTITLFILILIFVILLLYSIPGALSASMVGV